MREKSFLLKVEEATNSRTGKRSGNQRISSAHICHTESRAGGSTWELLRPSRSARQYSPKRRKRCNGDYIHRQTGSEAPHAIRGDGDDAEFFARLPNGRFQRRLPGFDSATWTVDLSCTEPALFAHEQNFSIANHKKQCGEFLWPPVGPIDLHREQSLAAKRKKTNLRWSDSSSKLRL